MDYHGLNPHHGLAVARSRGLCSHSIDHSSFVPEPSSDLLVNTPKTAPMSSSVPLLGGAAATPEGAGSGDRRWRTRLARVHSTHRTHLRVSSTSMEVNVSVHGRGKTPAKAMSADGGRTAAAAQLDAQC